MTDEARPSNVEVMLALALTRRAPAGPCPTPEEIAAWHEGALDPDRQAAVDVHVAHCDECFAAWTGLLESADLLDDARAASSPAPRRPWWRLAGPGAGFGRGGLAAGFATLIAVAIAVPLLLQPSLDERLAGGFEALARSGAVVDEPWPWPEGHRTRNVAGSDTLGAAAAAGFRRGLADGLGQVVPSTDAWRTTIAELGESADPCEGPARAECAEAAEALFVAGRWAALLHVACGASPGAGTLPDAFWSEQATVLELMAARVADTLPDSPFARLLEQWTHAAGSSDDTHAALCGRASVLITLGVGS